MTTPRPRQAAISRPRSLPKSPKPGAGSETTVEHPWTPDPVTEAPAPPPAPSGDAPVLAAVPAAPRKRGSIDARRAKAAAIPPGERRTYMLGGRVQEQLRPQVDEYCRKHGMSVQEFVEAAAQRLLNTPEPG